MELTFNSCESLYCIPVTYIISYINYTFIEKTSYFSLPLPRLLSEAANTFCGVRCWGTSMFYNLYSNVHEIRDAFPISIGVGGAQVLPKVFSILKRVNPSLKTSASFLKTLALFFRKCVFLLGCKWDFKY